MPPKKQHESYVVHRPIKGDRQLCYKLRKGDDVLMRSKPGIPSYVARVEEIVTDLDGSSNPEVRVRWFYRPEDTKRGRRPFRGANEVFFSEHLGWESTETIEGKCKVYRLDSYTNLDFIRDVDFFWRFEYIPKTDAFDPHPYKSPHLVCKCKMPRNPDHFMMQCEQCSECFHPSCIGTTIEDAKKLDHFCCEECSEQHHDLTSNSNSTSKNSNSSTKRNMEVTKTTNKQTKLMRLT